MKILRRVLALLPAVCLQALWICVLLVWLAPWAAVLNFALSVLAFLFVLYLITKRQESTYRMLWLLVILTFPLAGALLYLLFGNRRTTRPLKKKLDAERERAGEPQNPDTTPLYDAMRAEEPRLAQTFRWVEDVTGFPLHENTGADYYPLGDEMFPQMLEAVRSAQKYVFLEYFIVDTGSLWDELTEALAEKAKQGVDVRVLYDDLGSISTFTKKDAEDLRRKGVRCEPFNPMVFIKGTLNCRSHRKMLVVDGRVAFSGGINLADEYVNRVVKYGHWKDIGFRLTGDAVGNYVRMFVEFWNAFTRDRIPDELLLPPSTPSGTRDGYVLSYYDSPLREDAVSNRLYIELLGQAKETAWFYTPYLMPGDALLDAFTFAARRGVDVRILLPGISDNKLAQRMAQSYYRVLLEAGVKLYEYEPGFVHAKACLVDGIVGTVGTVNLDYRSLFLHFENNSLFYRSSLLDRLREDYLSTQALCRELTLDGIGHGFWKWLADGILRVFTPLC